MELVYSEVLQFLGDMQEHIGPSTPLIAHGMIALFGAFVHASRVYRNGGTKNLLDFIVLTIMSSFSGVMFSLIGLHYFGESSYLTLALAGTGGFLGVEGMTFVVEYIRDKVFNIQNKSR